MEDKARTCKELLPVLQHTDYFSDLVDLKYLGFVEVAVLGIACDKAELVEATFKGGYKKHANVTCDNCKAMIVDIIRQIS